MSAIRHVHPAEFPVYTRGRVLTHLLSGPDALELHRRFQAGWSAEVLMREYDISRRTVYGPLTDETLCTILTGVLSPSGARSRRAELVDLGIVEARGMRVLKSGRRGTIWAAK